MAPPPGIGSLASSAMAPTPAGYPVGLDTQLSDVQHSGLEMALHGSPPLAPADAGVVVVSSLKPGRVVIVGGIDGAYYTLADLLKNIKFNFCQDNLVHVGDVVGSLKHSDAVLSLLKRHAVMGPAGPQDLTMLREVAAQQLSALGSPARPASPEPATAAAAGRPMTSALTSALAHPGAPPPQPQHKLAAPLLKHGNQQHLQALPQVVLLQQYGISLQPAHMAQQPFHPTCHAVFGAATGAPAAPLAPALNGPAAVGTCLGLGAAAGLLTCAVLPPLEALHASSPAFAAKLAAGLPPSREDLQMVLVEEPVSELDL